jgi:hypothetical protein
LGSSTQTPKAVRWRSPILGKSSLVLLPCLLHFWVSRVRDPWAVPLSLLLGTSLGGPGPVPSHPLHIRLCVIGGDSGPQVGV